MILGSRPLGVRRPVVDIDRPSRPGSPPSPRLRRELLGRLGVGTRHPVTIHLTSDHPSHQALTPHRQGIPCPHRTASVALDATPDDDIELVTDVLVIGGGPAGTWAAIRARQAGAAVVLVDKGLLAAPGRNRRRRDRGVGSSRRSRKPARRRWPAEGMNGWLSDRRWMRRVLDETYSRVPELDVVSYPFPVDDAGEPERGGLQGPDYMKRPAPPRRRGRASILDHSPVLELLVDEDGAVAGARRPAPPDRPDVPDHRRVGRGRRRRPAPS